jgi:rhamnogalacturonyl hydrolase YesR
MNSEEMEALTAEAACELNDLPRKSPKEKAKDLLKKAAGRGVRPDDPVFWPAGMLLMGLAESPAPAGRAAAEKYLSEWVKDRCRVLFPDDALAGYAALRLYSSLGDGEEKEEMKKACDAVFSFLRETPKNSEGSIIYNPARGNEYIYADGAGQTALFLSEYARVFGNREAGDLAALQITNFLKHGIDDRTGLPYHAYDLSSGQYLGILGWGRAAGWLLMGMAGILGDGKTADHDAGLIRGIERFRKDVLSLQRPDGLFSWELIAAKGHPDTSATGMIGWALTKMYRSGDMDTAGKISMERSAEIPAEELSEKYVKRSEETSAEVPPAICPEKTKYALMRLSDALQREIKDGKVYSSSAECLDFGMYPQNYGNNAWGQGAVLAFFSALLTIV